MKIVEETSRSKGAYCQFNRLVISQFVDSRVNDVAMEITSTFKVVLGSIPCIDLPPLNALCPRGHASKCHV